MRDKGHRNDALRGLGPLSRPAVFRTYAGLFMGTIVCVWVVAALSGAWAYLLVSAFAFGVIGVRTAVSRQRQPVATQVHLSTMLVALATGYLAALVFMELREGVRLRTGLLMFPIAAAAAAGLYLTFGPPSYWWATSRSRNR